MVCTGPVSEQVGKETQCTVQGVFGTFVTPAAVKGSEHVVCPSELFPGVDVTLSNQVITTCPYQYTSIIAGINLKPGNI